MNQFVAMFDGEALVRGFLYLIVLFFLGISPFFAWLMIKLYKKYFKNCCDSSHRHSHSTTTEDPY